MEDEINQLKRIFMEVFTSIESLDNFLELKIGDFDEWDSLGNFALLLRIEESFGIRFSADELSTISSIIAILDFIRKHRNITNHSI